MARRPENDVCAVTIGELPDTERVQRGLDEEAVAVRHDLDRDTGGLRTPDERNEAWVVGLGRRRGTQDRRVGVDQRHLPRHQPA